MLKISEDRKTVRTVTLRLEGRVIGPWVGELRQISETLLTEGANLAVDMAEVLFADERGIALLTSLNKRGASLQNTPPFMVEQLKDRV